MVSNYSLLYFWGFKQICFFSQLPTGNIYKPDVINWPIDNFESKVSNKSSNHYRITIIEKLYLVLLDFEQGYYRVLLLERSEVEIQLSFSN